MKLLISLLFINTALAGGYFCQGHCVSLDFDYARIDFMKYESIQIGSSDIKKAHAFLKTKCSVYDSILIDDINSVIYQTDQYGELEFQLLSSKPEISCTYDAKIRDGYMPYTGGLPVL